MIIGQGSSKIIDGGTISSPGHITCYNVVVINREKKKALMCHIWEGMHGGLSHRQIEDLKRFSSELGDKVAFIAEGAISYDSRSVAAELRRRNIEILPVKRLATGDARWNVDFDLESRQITVTDERGTVHYQDVPFPPYIEVQESERGLSDHERVLQGLFKSVDVVTGELDAAALEEFQKILEHPSPERSDIGIGHAILIGYMNERARQAGFDNYDDYFETKPSAFADIDLNGAEAALRKMTEMGLQRFKKAGKNLDDAKVTPELVMEILKDYPELLIQFSRSVDKSLAQSVSQ